MIELYVQQVRDCCRCFECADESQWEEAVRTALENWGNLTCGNWIDEHEIKLTVPLSKICSCCPNIFRVNLPEEWIQTETIETKVRAWVGLDLREIEVNFVFDEYSHDLMVDLSEAIDCCSSRCEKYDLVIDYKVGTDIIPEELCRWFCAIAKVYMELEEVECASCGSLDNVAIVEVDGTRDLSATIKTLAMTYFNGVISKHSLCLLKSLTDWTVVV